MLMFKALFAMAAFASFAFAAPAAAQAPVLRVVRVAADAYMVQGLSALGSSANRNFISNAAFVVTPEGVLVVDALGSPALALELLGEIRRITPAPVRYVVVTHYHADHIYGLQAFKDAGATIIAQRDGLVYLNSDTAQLRLAASREELAPAVNDDTRLVAANRWIDHPTMLQVGGIDFLLQPAGPAHTPEDMVVWVPQLKLLFAGDLVFRGRIPFVGQADSGRWIAALDTLLAFDARIIVPGHGPASADARADLELTRDYLAYLRRTMGEAARNLDSVAAAYARTDWSRFDKLPLFGPANRINAYNTYLLMEQAAK
jgi:glyoxylase-like metal-dependent hydrolase (beta-lactamase superfamily II)